MAVKSTGSRVRLNVGTVGQRKIPRYPSEPGYVAAVRQAMNEVTTKVESIINQFENATPEILIAALQPTYDKSQIYCPIKTGVLRDSGYLEVVTRGKKPRVELGYAKAGNPDYAIYVHEMIGIPHEPPTQAKFLQKAVEEDMSVLFYRIGENYAQFAAFVGQATIGY